MLKNRDIICIANVPWDYLKIAAQQTTKYLSEHNNIIYVENPLSMAGYLYEKAWLKKAKTEQKKGLRNEINRLHVLPPPLALPYRAKFAMANQLTAGRMLPHIKKAVKELNFNNPILWIYNVFAGAYIVGKLNEALVVYDCTDEFSADPNVNTKMYKKLELKVLKAADVVLAISRNLVADKEKNNDNVHYLPIGGEPDHFLTCHDDNLEVPEDIASLKKPVVGYYGRLDERFDTDWLAGAAKEMPDASFALIGPTRGTETESALKDIPNVHFLGSRDYKELPAYMKAFDVCIMPYVMSDFVKNIFPNKIFEYLASGRPVITSEIPSLQDLADDGVVDIVSSKEDFIKFVKAGIEENDPSKREQRIDTAKKNSWLARAEKASDIIEAFENEQQRNF